MAEQANESIAAEKRAQEAAHEAARKRAAAGNRLAALQAAAFVCEGRYGYEHGVNGDTVVGIAKRFESYIIEGE